MFGLLRGCVGGCVWCVGVMFVVVRGLFFLCLWVCLSGYVWGWAVLVVCWACGGGVWFCVLECDFWCAWVLVVCGVGCVVLVVFGGCWFLWCLGGCAMLFSGLDCVGLFVCFLVCGLVWF